MSIVENRTITGNGMLSQSNEKRPTASPIYFNFGNGSGKPAPDHINKDKKYEEQKKYQAEQLDLQKQALALQKKSSKKKGGSVLCTHYNKIGFMPDSIYKIESDFGDWLEENQVELVEWYWSWAIPLTRMLHGETLWSQIVTILFWPFVNAWATQIAYEHGAVDKGSFMGSLFIKFALWRSKKMAAHA